MAEKQWVINYDKLATTQGRADAIAIVNVAYEAIATDHIIRNALRLEGSTLQVNGFQYSLEDYDHIHVVGFGKASCKAAYEVEQLLGSRIKSGAVVSILQAKCEIISTFEGTHPKPSASNVEASQAIVDIADHATERDLVIVIVSGGGSSLLCWPASECDQGQRLYQEFLTSGGTIEEINTVRKHLSGLKGGGLAEKLYPATVVGLIFSDVPGGDPSIIASGPTYRDTSTKQDAEELLATHGLSGYDLVETPKDPKFFERVHNILLVSNQTALDAMAEKATALGYTVVHVGNNRYDFPQDLLNDMLKKSTPRSVVMGAGEPRLIVDGGGGSGGRMLYTAMEAIPLVQPGQVFIAFASDGHDNCEVAGGLADILTRGKGDELGLELKDYLDTYDALSYYKKVGDALYTGQTEANVSDLFILLNI